MHTQHSKLRLHSEKWVDWALTKRAYLFYASMTFLLIALGSLVFRGLNYAMDFTGGLSLSLEFQKNLSAQTLRDALKDSPFKSASIQTLGTKGNRFSISLQGQRDKEDADKILLLFKKNTQEMPKVLGKNQLGATIGNELKLYGAFAFLTSLGLIALYLSFRFQWRFALGAILALLHDAIFVLGIFSIFHISFDLTTLAAILAVVGYSVNDTIVVYDRIREEFRNRKSENIELLIRHSVVAVLGRTIMTTGTTLLVTLSLLIYAGEELYGFSLALSIGIIAGTYSTTFIAIHLLTLLGLKRQDIVPDPKKRAKLDAMP